MRSTGARPATVDNLVLTRERAGRGRRRARRGAHRRGPRPSCPASTPARADIILAGALILEQVVHELDIDELVVSDYALREGVLLDAWQRRHGGSLHHLSDLRRRASWTWPS